MKWLTMFLCYPLVLGSLTLASGAFAQDTPKTLLVGAYNSKDGANAAYDELKKIEKTKAIDIDAFAIVSKNDKGRTDVYSTRQKDTRWGAVVGGVIGLLTMGPVGAVGGAGVGGGSGWMVGSATGISKGTIKNIESALEPNTSALVAVVDNKWVADVEKALKAKATKTVIKEELRTDRIKESIQKEEKAESAH